MSRFPFGRSVLLSLLVSATALPVFAQLDHSQLPTMPVSHPVPQISTQQTPDPTGSTNAATPYRPRAGRAKPVVAVVGANESTELIDFVAPFGILSRSGVADVRALGVEPGPIKMRPAVVVQPEATTGQFDQELPEGADFVIVPAGPTDRTAPALVSWLQAQSAKGAMIVSICDGALAVARAGLFKGHRATGHFATRTMREREFPNTQWVHNVRYVFDGEVASSAGVSAALPMSVALVEAIAGRDRAAAVAQELGLVAWDSGHNSEGFSLGAVGLLRLSSNGWIFSRDDIELPIADGVDELTLAITADAMGRTNRTRTYTSAKSTLPVRTRNGLVIVPDRLTSSAPSQHLVTMSIGEVLPGEALDRTLAEIDRRYGKSTGDLVSIQLEYPR
jgi:transcriptional regulator GlxA family with amidase domain